MSTDRQYDVFITRPPKGSRFEFFVASFTIVEDEEFPANAPSPWLGCVSPPDGLEDREAQKWSRFNLRAARNGLSVDEHVSKQFIAIGAPDLRDTRVRDMLKVSSIGMRLAVDALARAYDEKSHIAKQPANGFRKTTCWDVVKAANEALGRPGPQALATFFNEEMSNSSRGHGLDPDHIGRALKAYDKWHTPADIVGMLLGVDRLDRIERRFRALDYIAAKSTSVGCLKRHRGAALASAIHHRYDIFEQIDRAERALRLSSLAA
ncbi:MULTISPECIES: hypothetical protein [Agrobacterium]|uniref:hypothetical protein n=1 Tax=Agrobacterium TaxID=357 RepID=UPI00045A4E0E|nr:hypothetical protein [Agrobacterium tumefaciens]CDN91994.1 hypothetical protein BN949_01135 [Agrobacterium tumefaciens]